MPGKRGGSPTGKKTSPVTLLAQERAIKALECRKKGMAFAAIARVCGYNTTSAAYQAVQRAMHMVIRQPAEEVRQLEIERLDALIQAMWPAAMSGNFQAVDRVLAIMTRRSAYLGLDAPQRVDHEHRIRQLAEQNGFDPDEAIEEARRVLREARG